jgi:hypothetical protein
VTSVFRLDLIRRAGAVSVFPELDKKRDTGERHLSISNWVHVHRGTTVLAGQPFSFAWCEACMEEGDAHSSHVRHVSRRSSHFDPGSLIASLAAINGTPCLHLQ